jgi:hypothetical protein
MQQSAMGEWKMVAHAVLAIPNLLETEARARPISLADGW